MEPRPGPSRPIRMTRTLMLTLAAAGMLASGCGQQASVPTHAPEALVGCTQTQSKAAARNAVETAAKTVRDLRVAEVVRSDVTIENGAISSFRVRLAISFKYESGD